MKTHEKASPMPAAINGTTRGTCALAPPLELFFCSPRGATVLPCTSGLPHGGHQGNADMNIVFRYMRFASIPVISKGRADNRQRSPPKEDGRRPSSTNAARPKHFTDPSKGSDHSSATIRSEISVPPIRASCSDRNSQCCSKMLASGEAL